MLYRKTLVVGAFLCAIIILCGCSGNGNIVAPEPDAKGPVDPTVEGIREGVELKPSHMTWGVYEIHLNMTNWTAGISLKRAANWHANILPFLFPPYCPANDCLVIDNFEGWILPFTAQFDGVIKHPFGGDPNLDGFDIRGIGILSPNKSFPSGDVPVQVILNPDGFTSLWHESIYVPNSDINPFKAFWTKDEMRRFENGKTDSRKFIVQFPPSGYLDFDMAIDASYEFPHLVIPGDPATSPNSWEAYEITATLLDTINETLGSSAPIRITLYDWQENPGPVTIEAPDLFNGSINLGGWVTHGADYTFEYETTLTNSNAVGPGLYPVLLKCVDSFDVSVPDLDLIAYNILMVNVEPFSGPLPPVAIAEANKVEAYPGEVITFDASDSYDPEGYALEEYLWDFNNDQDYTDDEGEIVDHFFGSVGLKYVDVKVIDVDDMEDVLDVKITVNIIPSPNLPPVAMSSANIHDIPVGGSVIFSSDGSYDPDGEIVAYEWDLDGDGDYGDPAKGEDQPNPTFKYNFEGQYFVWLMVQDDDGAWDKTNQFELITVAGENIPPTASGEVNCEEPQTNKPIIFTSTSMDPDGFLISWEWDFGDGWEDFTETEGLATHAFTGPGIYYVDHRVYDIVGEPDTLDALMEIIVADPDYVVPSPNDCSSVETTHSYHIDFDLGIYDHSTTYDICPTPDVSWLLGASGKLIIIDLYGDPVDEDFHTLIGFGPFLLSLDYDQVNNYYSYIYDDMPFSPAQIQIIDSNGASVTTIDLSDAPLAVCFDWDGNLWVLVDTWEIKVFIAAQNFVEDPCLGYAINEIAVGRVYDMALDFYNHSLYVFSQGSDGLGRLDSYDQDGSLAGSVSPIFDPITVGFSNVGDIVIDNSSGDGQSDCRIELFSGITVGAVARFDSELNLIDSSIFSFWGCKAATIEPFSTVVLVLEACCAHYFDRYVIAPGEW